MSLVKFTQEQDEKMIDCFGEDFTKQLPIKVMNYAKKWQLEDLSLIEYYSVNCLFTCHSLIYGDCVLKIFGCGYEWYISEVRTLLEFKGNNQYVKVYQYDIEDGVLLLERINPGTTLKKEPSIDKRLLEFTTIYKNAHIIPNNPNLYESYLETVKHAANKPWVCGEIPELRKAAKEMVVACCELYNHYPFIYLLHADLHGDNLLLNAQGNYTIVDPHGRIGPSICDLGRYIANEYDNENIDTCVLVIEYIIEQLSKILELPRIDIIRAFFVDITLMTCWDAENNIVDCAIVMFALNLLNQELKNK